MKVWYGGLIKIVTNLWMQLPFSESVMISEYYIIFNDN